VYSDQEVVVENDGDELSPDGEMAPPLAQGLPDLDADEPLPRRPVPLGKNRLPEIAVPGRERVLVSAASFGVGLFDAKLSPALALPALGWRPAHLEDPLGVVSGHGPFGYRAQALGGGPAGHGREAAIDRQLGFLEATPTVEPLRAFTLPNGITVRV